MVCEDHFVLKILHGASDLNVARIVQKIYKLKEHFTTHSYTSWVHRLIHNQESLPPRVLQELVHVQ